MRALTAFFFFFKCTWQLWTLRSNGAWSHCLLNKGFMRRNPEIIALDREQTTVLRIHCSIGCFHKSCTFFSVPYYVSEVKPTTCFALIRECFAIWLKVQLPRTAILDCSSFSPMIDLSLTLFIRLLECLSCYSKGRIAMNLLFFILYILYIYIYFFLFLNGSLNHDHASKRIVRLSNVIWSLECFSRTHGSNATPLSYVAIGSNENWCLRGFIIVADDWYSWWKFSRYFMRMHLIFIAL